MKNQTDVHEDNLADPELALLAEIRSSMGPDPSDQRRVRAGLSASLAAGNLGPRFPPETACLGHGHTEGISAGIQGLGRQILAGAFIASIGFGVGFWTGQGPGTHPAGVVQPATQQAPVVHQPKLEPANSRADEQPPKAQASGGSLNATTKARGADTRMLTEEAEALRRVGQALRDGQPGLAKQILDDLDVRNPRGALLEERNAARLMVRCRNGDENARAAAQTWLKRHPRSVYAPRVRVSCFAEEEP